MLPSTSGRSQQRGGDRVGGGDSRRPLNEVAVLTLGWLTVACLVGGTIALASASTPAPVTNTAGADGGTDCVYAPSCDTGGVGG